jgi:hypothetical protein
MRLPILLALLAGVLSSANASADPPPADVRVPEEPTPWRRVSIEWNPLPLILGKVSANVLVVPANHHALVLTPFFVQTTTQGIFVFDAQGNSTQLPQQTFSGFGGEIGYRYYTGNRGPRGFFAGPSLILGGMTAKAQNGDKTSYLDYGVAFDIGYELLVADAVAITLGAGAQYTTPSRSIPDQQFPADVYANSRVFPRALFAVGWAL